MGFRRAEIDVFFLARRAGTALHRFHLHQPGAALRTQKWRFLFDVGTAGDGESRTLTNICCLRNTAHERLKDVCFWLL